MSLPQIEALVTSILQEVTTLENSLNTLISNTETFGVRLTSTLDQMDAIISVIPGTLAEFTRIQKDIDHIDHVLGITLIVTLIIGIIFFIFWFFTHIWPMVAGEHKHKHDLRHILRDLGTTTSHVIHEK